MSRCAARQIALFAPVSTASPRSDTDETDRAEYYRTPSWCVDDLLEYGPPELRAALLPGAVWQDPCAGDGRIPWAVDAWCVRQGAPPPSWQLLELRAGALADADLEADRWTGDYLSAAAGEACERMGEPTVVIMNTPFTLTCRFIQAVWQRFPRARVASLQRQSWRGCRARADWIAAHQPRTFTFGSHRPRPKFLASKTSDPAEYEWSVYLADERDCRTSPPGWVLQPLPEDAVQRDLFASNSADLKDK